MVEGVVAVVRREARYLLIQRAPSILAGGAWCFVGGAMEQGESQRDAVTREFFEEVGGVIRPVRKIWESVRPAALRLHWWAAELVDGKLTPNPAEVAAFGWFDVPEALALPHLLETNREFFAQNCGGNPNR